jgi:hypothetical protein
MQRAKLVLAFTAALMILAVAAIPASAWFHGKTPQGNAHGLPSTLSGPGAGSFTCSKWEGAWHIESSGKVLEQSKGPGQQLTKEGPHEAYTISKWNECLAHAGTSNIPITVKPCILQVEQPLKGVNTGGTGSVVEACLIKLVVPATEKSPEVKCEIGIPVLGNERLPKVEYATAGANVEAKSEVKGLRDTVSPECAALGIVGSNENVFKGIVVAEEQSLV